MFDLRVQKLKQDCLFELSWGRSQRLSTTLPFLEILDVRYQEWQQAYFNFYSHSQTRPLSMPLDSASAMRGRPAGSGSLAPATVDWQARLVEAESRLLYDFHRWLRSPELYEIQAKLAEASRTLDVSSVYVDVFLTCTPIEMMRLPWEAWEMGGARGKIRLSRSPANIRHEAAVQPKHGRSRPRILVIMGYDQGQSFQADWQTVKRSLTHLADIPDPVGYIAGQSVGELKTRISWAIADPQGWDVLIFAGHSNETQMTGGELGIAPGVSIQIQEIEGQLAIAKQNGLKFAMFNSCNGLSIAESLINLGLNQVVVMREPIHNRVAQAFLIQFLQGLAVHQDVHEALVATCQYFKTEANLTHPSAHLVPSLFRYPGVAPFRLQPAGWRSALRHLRPRVHELVALVILVPLSLSAPTQRVLLEQRALMQAIYRDLTNQISERPPEILLVQVNDQSIIEAEIGNPEPMDRTYLAQLVNHAAEMDVPVIGVDFVLDRRLPEQDPSLAEALQGAIANNNDIRLVFASFRNREGQWLKTHHDIVDPDSSWHGDITLWNHGRSMTLLPSDGRPLPFSYLLALARTLHAESTPTPSVISQHDQPADLIPYLFSTQMRPSRLTRFSYNFQQVWMRPIVDFSMPPASVYATVPAWQFLNTNPEQLRQLYPQPVVMIAPGGYDLQPGVSGADQFPVPAAMQYWWQQQNLQVPESITGAEIHAYLFEHFSSDRLMIPIPDLWMLGLAVIVGKGLVVLSLYWGDRWHGVAILTTTTMIYGILSLQLYVTAALVLPWSLPTLLILIYGIPALVWRNRYA